MQDDETEDKSKKSSFKSISDHASYKSHKDTMSSEVSNTLKLIHENMRPFFTNDKLEDFDPVSLLGKGSLGQVCMVRYILK